MASHYMAISVMPFARVVRTVHNNFTFTGWLRLRRRLTRMLNRALGVRYLAISPSVQATEWNNFANPTQLCLNWYDSEHFCPPTARTREAARKSFGFAEGDIAVISIGNCSPIKNHMAIIEALPQLSGSMRIVYLHAGCETERGEEREAAARLGLSRPGPLPRRVVRRALLAIRGRSVGDAVAF